MKRLVVPAVLIALTAIASAETNPIAEFRKEVRATKNVPPALRRAIYRQIAAGLREQAKYDKKDTAGGTAVQFERGKGKRQVALASWVSPFNPGKQIAYLTKFKRVERGRILAPAAFAPKEYSGASVETVVHIGPKGRTRHDYVIKGGKRVGEIDAKTAANWTGEPQPQ